MIVLLNDSIRGVVSNEETFWSFLEKELPNCKGLSTANLSNSLKNTLNELNPSLIIQNSNLGKISNFKTISFLQDPFIEMEKKLELFQDRLKAKIRGRETYSDKIKKQIESFSGSTKVTNSNYMANMYKKFGEFHVIPMGTDPELFRPLEKKELKKKYNIPLDRKVNIFVGSQHSVKGFDKIQKMIVADPSIFWILVLKDHKIYAGHNFVCFEKVSQKVLAELYNCADLCVSRSITESFSLALVEAMFCDIPVDVPKIGVFWDWDFDSSNPRRSALAYGLDKNTWMGNWKKFVKSCV